jgi:hypothetical protein
LISKIIAGLQRGIEINERLAVIRGDGTANELIGLCGITQIANVQRRIGERSGTKRLVKHLVEFALRDDHCRRVRTISEIQQDGSRHELRDCDNAYEHDYGGEHHLKDAEAPFPAAAFCGRG